MYTPHYTTVSGVQNFMGNIHMPTDAQVVEQIENAEGEVDSALASIYDVPIDTDDISDSNKNLLDTMCAKLAGGYLIISSASAGEDINVHAYGKMLITEARDTLQKIVAEDILLIGAEDTTDYIAPNSSAPKIRVDHRRFDANGTQFGGRLNIYRDKKSWFGDDDDD
jgi:hypothetical protein